MEDLSQACNSSLLLGIAQALNLLTVELENHSNQLAKQSSSLEELTRAIQQLEATLKKEESGQSQPSLELKETVESFVENSINRQYYQGMRLLKLNRGAPEIDLEPGPN